MHFFGARKREAKRLMLHFFSPTCSFISGKKRRTRCVTSPPRVDAFHQRMVQLLFLSVTQRGSPAKITSLIYRAEGKWHEARQCLSRLSIVFSTSVDELFNGHHSSRGTVWLSYSQSKHSCVIGELGLRKHRCKVSISGLERSESVFLPSFPCY